MAVPEGGVNDLQHLDRSASLETSLANEPLGDDDNDVDDIFTDSEHGSTPDESEESIERIALSRSHVRKPAANAFVALDDQISALARHAGKLKLSDALAGQQPKGDKEKDKSNRATSEQVLDNRTRMILLQMINKNIVSEVYGCVSTGKEANVYHAVTALSDDRSIVHRAIKVYKTSILQFKARSKYVEGDFRFQSGYNKSSNRAMVKQWAEKEMRNLRRIYAAGIPCPEPIHLRFHVLVMGFLGDKRGTPAPRLKDVVLEGEDVEERWRNLYVQLLGYIRKLYGQCRLVHADLSEYNVMYHDDKLYLIDVSQSVEHDHPESLNFLRSDIKNVNDFFGRQGVNVLSERTVFEFVTVGGNELDIARILRLEDATAAEARADTTERDVDEAVFRSQHIPRTLQEVDDIEKQATVVAAGGKDSAVYKALLADSVGPSPDVANRQDHEGSSSSRDENDTSDEDRLSFGDRTPRGKRFEDKDAKRAHKHQVKEEKREKRKTKMPKHVKKRLVKETAQRKH